MKVLITGAKGFIGKNLVAQLNNIKEGKAKHNSLGSALTLFEFDKDTDPSLLDEYCQKADFVFHLAGVNRPKEQSEFMEGNFGFTSDLLDTLKKHNNNCPIMLSSSIQAELDNPYGESKKAGEDLLLKYGKETGAKVYIYRFPNVFGKWCRPNYNSAVATFCHNIAHDLPVQVNDPNHPMTLVYIDDVVQELINCLVGNPNKEGDYCKVATEHQIKLGEIVELIKSFKESRTTLQVPNLSDSITKKLYSTYLSYLPEDSFSYPLKMNVDERGSFTEFLKSPDRGQVSINISKPGITKGQHWHHTKNEKFLVVSGTGVIRFRKINEPSEIIEYHVSGEKLEVVDIPVGYTHNIENLGNTDMVTVMWVNEVFDPEHPDTFFLPV
ncbi:MAG TPA: capsular polysaccharide biosynthesis protein CapF [Bacteroidales bacterium]|nr:capsular polysaccharide biosynthesis protein CapF [Bacteroidales bacterium]